MRGAILIPFIADRILKIIKSNANLAVFIIKYYQHFVIININAVQECVDKGLILLGIIEVYLAEFIEPEAYLVFTENGILNSSPVSTPHIIFLDKPSKFDILALTGDDFGFRWDWLKSPGPTKAGMFSATFYSRRQGNLMKELSIFIDESGFFGAYLPHAPYYIVTLVFHNQAVDISSHLAKMQEHMRLKGMPDYTVHAGPLIRREYEYKDLDVIERQRVFNSLYHFIRTLDITYHPIIVEKNHVSDDTELITRIAKQLSSFLRDNFAMFTEYDRVVVYYDYGQRDLNLSIVSIFSALLSNVEFKKVAPSDYKLFQAADMLCTLELLALKRDKKCLSKSELKFFKSSKDLYKSYIRAIKKKQI